MRPVKTSFLLLISLALAAPLFVQADEIHRETKEQRFDAGKVREIAILNLAGAVTLKGTSGTELVVKAELTGAGRSAADARHNANLLSLDVQQHGDRVEIVTVYPVDDHDEYVYRRDDGKDGFFGWGSHTTTTYLDERVSVRSGGGGLAVHADYEVQVPAGVTVHFKNNVGDIRADNVNAALVLDTSSGGIAVTGGKGDVSADTGSGSIDVSEREGKVLADTGSGGVDVRKVKGEVRADTGSGGVSVTDVTGDVEIDTGSGGADLANVTGSVRVDTGSGGVDGRNLQQVRELEIDTGSGSVELDGDFSAMERMMIDTGSGGVRIRTRGTLNMQLTVSAGSGGVRVDLPGMQNVRTSRNEFEARIGNGEGRGVIDTGSGGVRITSE